ncbi:MAG: hypothetical protein IPM64_06760 [Phycisphaerales bacterium]|nr:hypothetical protein [Phycisphaerales bacterium]
MSLAPQGLLLDESGRVAVDLACTRCGYNLRMLEFAGNCPECGQGVREGYLRQADVVRAAMVAIRRGARFMAVGFILGVMAVVTGAAGHRSMIAATCAGLLLLVGHGVIGVGALQTTAHPIVAGVLPTLARYASRVLVSLYIASLVIFFVALAPELVGIRSGALRRFAMIFGVIPGLGMPLFIGLCLGMSGVAAGAVKLPNHRVAGILLGIIEGCCALVIPLLATAQGGLVDVVAWTAICGQGGIVLVSIIYCASLAGSLDERMRTGDRLADSALSLPPPSSKSAIPLNPPAPEPPRTGDSA